MYPIKRILVALDLTELDPKLISAASKLAEALPVEKVYFFHVAKSLELPEEIEKDYPDLLAPLDESLKVDMSRSIAAHFLTNTDYQIEIKEGNAADQIMHWSDIKEIDLIIVGRKLEMKGEGVLPGKLARLAHCSIMFIPENVHLRFDKLLIPIDFSRNSSLALDMAKMLKEKFKSTIVLHNSFKVPTGYHTTGKTYEEFIEIMKSHAEKDTSKFIKRNEVGDEVEVLLTHDEIDNPAEHALNAANKAKADLIIMSSKGRSGLANFLIGSVAEKMISIDASIPLLIAKDKKHNMGFLDALLKL